MFNKVVNLTYLFIIIYTIINDIYNNIISINIINRDNIKDDKFLDSMPIHVCKFKRAHLSK